MNNDYAFGWLKVIGMKIDSSIKREKIWEKKQKKQNTFHAAP